MKVIAAAVLVAVALTSVGCTSGNPDEVKPSQNGSQRATAPSEYSSAPECGDSEELPCVTSNDTGQTEYVLVVSYNPYKDLPFNRCTTEDSPHCIFDTETQGNGQRGSGVHRFVVNY